MLRWRLLAAASILTPLALLLYADVHWNGGVPGIWVIPLGWLLTMAATAELLDLLTALDGRPSGWAVYLGSSVLFLAGCLPVAQGLFGVAVPLSASLELLGCSAVALTCAATLLFGVEMCRYRDPGRSVARLAVALFVVVYPGLFMSLLAQLRFVHSNAWGMAALISLVWVVKFSDTCAYAAGRTFGRHKMSPRLSPGKTIEGAIGALLGAAFASWVYFQFLIPSVLTTTGSTPHTWGSLGYGLAVGGAGMVGDLAESLVKRDMQRKDSSRWLPGLGGVLDILDSLLLAAPVALFCWLAGIVGP